MDHNLFLNYFSGRTDIVPKFYDFKGKDGKRIAGYTPICSKAGQQSCPKKTGSISSCSACPSPDYVSISESLLSQHFDGKIILGIYPMLSDGQTCRFIAGDFDNHGDGLDPKSAVRRLWDVCDMQEIPLAVLKSKSGNGYHAYVFFSESIPARKARIFFHSLLEEAQIADDKSFDRMFPNQDSTGRGKGVGNLIALPFQGISNGNFRFTGFLKPDLETLIEDQWDYLSRLERIPESRIDALLADWNISIERIPKKQTEKQKIKATDILSGIQEGERDEKLFRYACQLKAKGLEQDEIAILIYHAAERCSPPFPREQALEKVQSAMKYETPIPRAPKDDGWVDEAITKVHKGADRQRVGRLLVSYWFRQSGNIDDVRLTLYGWNIKNDPPLDASELDEILKATENRQAYENFMRHTGLDIIQMELRKYPDGRQEYRMFLADVPDPVCFDSASLISKSAFIKKIHEATRVVIKPPAEKGQPGIWADLITAISQEATIELMPEEMTIIDRIRQIITNRLANFEETDDIDWHSELESQIILYNGKICFKANAFIRMCRGDNSEELKHIERRELNQYLEKMGFESPVKLTKIAGKPVRVFSIPEGTFRNIK